MSANTSSAQVSARNPTIDILRGIAIFTMVAANLSSTLLQDADKVLLFRLYGTFAAPLFILLAGMMVVMTQSRHGGFRHYLHRGVLIIGCACLLDVAVWRIYPFLSYDVLYLIGLSIPVTYLLTRYCQISTRLVIAALLLVLTPLMQNLFAYREELVSIELSALSFRVYLDLLFSAATLQRLLLDGWFPIMPWLSCAVIGSILGTLYNQAYEFASKPFLLIGLTILSLGVSLWVLQNPQFAIREGYSELFYPPTTGYFLTATGLLMVSFYCVETTKQHPLYSVFLKLGHASLFMYLFHQILLASVLMPIAFFNHQPMIGFLLLYASVIALMVMIGHALHQFKQRYKNLPFIIRFIVGS